MVASYAPSTTSHSSRPSTFTHSSSAIFSFLSFSIARHSISASPSTPQQQQHDQLCLLSSASCLAVDARITSSCFLYTRHLASRATRGVSAFCCALAFRCSVPASATSRLALTTSLGSFWIFSRVILAARAASASSILLYALFPTLLSLIKFMFD